MQPTSPSRREFLKQGSGVLIGALVFSSGPIALLAPSKVWALELSALEETPFFGKVRGTCVGALYDNPLAYAHFGYEGSSWEKGGYLQRGFNDLKWLPDPPANASPPLAPPGA